MEGRGGGGRGEGRGEILAKLKFLTASNCIEFNTNQTDKCFVLSLKSLLLADITVNSKFFF